MENFSVVKSASITSGYVMVLRTVLMALMNWSVVSLIQLNIVIA